MRKNLYIGMVAGFSLSLSLGIVWDAAWEARPAGTELASDIDLFIQEFKDEVADRDTVEHVFGIGSDDNGLARLGSARTFIQNGAPTDILGPGQYNSASGATAGTALGTEEIGASVIDLGTGRLWVDLDGLDGVAGNQDDRQLNVWTDGAVAFSAVTADPPVERVGNNLIRNGSFEITDGTGSLASITVASGWVNLNTATIAYDSVNNSTEGDGVAMETIAAGGTNEGAVQTLAGLKESTVYVVRARVRPVGAGDNCDLVATGGVVTPLSDTSATATNVFETLEVVVTTTAAPADILVNLESNAIGDECDWDHVTAFERNALVAPPGIQAVYTQDNTNDTTLDAVFTNNVYLTSSVTIPSAGYIVLVDAAVTVEVCNGAIGGRIARDCGGGFAAVSPVYLVDSKPGACAHGATFPLNFVDNILPADVGATCSYRVEVREIDTFGISDTAVNPITDVTVVQTGSSLRLLLMPIR